MTTQLEQAPALPGKNRKANGPLPEAVIYRQVHCRANVFALRGLLPDLPCIQYSNVGHCHNSHRSTPMGWPPGPMPVDGVFE